VSEAAAIPSGGEEIAGEPGIDFQLSKPTTWLDFGKFVAAATVDSVKHRRDFRDVERFFFLVGYPRSGSTLIGSVLNAHPEMVIAHESDLFRYVRPGITRNQLFALLLRRDRQFAAVDRRWNGFDYALDSEHQGRFVHLRVIGDKHSGRAARRIHQDPALLDRLRRVVKVPIRVLHIIRNPFDNIASIAHNRDLPVARAIEIYRSLGVAVTDVCGRLHSDELFEVRYEEFTKNAAESLTGLCRFIGVEAPAEYVKACAALTDPGGRQSRTRFEWSGSERQQVERIIASRPVLEGYTFEN
jgi:Sulfotransferase family